MDGAEIATLKSGLRVVVAPVPGVESVTALAMVGVGSRFEDKNKNGICHFLEHLVFKGTAKWPEAFDLSSAVDSIGADFNAFTGKEYTGFYVKSAGVHLEFALDVLSDMLCAPQLREVDLEREKGVVIEEINMYNDLPQRQVGDEFDSLIYGEVGLGRRIDGEREIVRGFTRDDFLEHRKRWYGLNNVVVVVSGSKKALDGLGKKVEEYFAKGEELGRVDGERVLGFESQEDRRVRVVYKDSDQAHFILGYPGLALTHPDRYVLGVLSVVLGGNMSSRLFNEVREKRGLAYYTHCDVDRYIDTGSIAVAEGVDVKRIDEAVRVSLGVFEEVAGDGEKGVSEEELTKAKDYLAGKMVLSLEDSRSLAQFWGGRLVTGDEIIEPLEVIEKIRSVGRDDVARVAGELLAERKKLNFSLVGPYKDEERFVKLFG